MNLFLHDRALFIETQGLPRNGGEKNYLEFIYRRPKFLVSYVYAMLVVLIVRLLRALLFDQAN